jgi:hypothetical protein
LYARHGLALSLLAFCVQELQDWLRELTGTLKGKGLQIKEPPQIVNGNRRDVPGTLLNAVKGNFSTVLCLLQNDKDPVYGMRPLCALLGAKERA